MEIHFNGTQVSEINLYYQDMLSPDYTAVVTGVLGQSFSPVDKLKIKSIK